MEETIKALFFYFQPLAKEPLSMRVQRGPLTEEVTSYYSQVKHTLRIHKFSQSLALYSFPPSFCPLCGSLFDLSSL